MSPFISACLRPTALATAILSALPLMAKADDTSPVVSSSTVTLSNLRFELVDINPNDGITPSVSFDLTGQLSVTDVSGTTSTSYSNALLPLTPTTLVSSNGHSSITTTADSVTLKSFTTLQDALSASSGFTTTPGYNDGNTGSNNSANLSVSNPQSIAGNLTGMNFGQFTLSANTILRITGTATSSSTLDATPLLAALPGNAQNPAVWINKYPNYQAATLALGKLTVAQNGDASSITGLQGSAATLAYPPSLSVSQTSTAASYTQSQAFDLVFTNLGDTSTVGDVLWTLGASEQLSTGWSYLLPDVIVPPPDVPGIPEPSTYALMGLGLVGIALTRRRIAR